MSFKRKLAGLEAKKNGSRAEQVLEDTSTYYSSSLLIYKRYEPYKRVSGKGRVFRAVYAGVAGCDYSIFMSDGRAGMIEVKSRRSNRLQKSALSESQHFQLDQLMKWKHLSFLLIFMCEKWILISYAQFMTTKRKSHNFEQLLSLGTELICTDGILVNLTEAIDEQQKFNELCIHE